MKPLFLDGEQVEKHLPLPDLLDGIEKSFVNYSNKVEGLIHPQRLVLNVQKNDLFWTFRTNRCG